MKFDYSKLKGRIIEKYGKQAAFAKAIGISEHTMSFKLNGKNCFTQNEIKSICEKLTIPILEIGDYFFTAEVQTA